MIAPQNNLPVQLSDKSIVVSTPDFLAKYSIALPSAITALALTNAVIPLDSSYQPGYYDVVCGRGKGSYNRPGNKRFRALVATYIPDYQIARSKFDKSCLLSSIIDKVRSFTNPDTGMPAEFVKFSKGDGWIQIGDELAREKVGHVIREAVLTKEANSNPFTETSSYVANSINSEYSTHEFKDDSTFGLSIKFFD